jgi:hypothetical protein
VYGLIAVLVVVAVIIIIAAVLATTLKHKDQSSSAAPVFSSSAPFVKPCTHFPLDASISALPDNFALVSRFCSIPANDSVPEEVAVSYELARTSEYASIGVFTAEAWPAAQKLAVENCTQAIKLAASNYPLNQINGTIAFSTHSYTATSFFYIAIINCDAAELTAQTSVALNENGFASWSPDFMCMQANPAIVADGFCTPDFAVAGGICCPFVQGTECQTCP